MFPTKLKCMLDDLPPGTLYIALLVTCIAMVPPAVILRARAVPSEHRRIHLIQNMDNQPKFVDQQENILFRDTRSMRPAVPGTVSRSQMIDDTHLHLGTMDGEFVTTFPSQVSVDSDLLKRGQICFEIYCLPCHGVQGYGDGPVHKRAMVLLNTGTNGTTWVQPKSLHEEAIDEYALGQVFWVISNGVRNMAGYKSQIRVEDRWAIVAWVEALQLSESAPAEDVPDADSLPVINNILPGEEDES
ncbi:MAG: cytochrome c [Phycisphaerales bacterium]|nr:cytochrome c [Phycisphaerales bacterium]